MESKTKADTHSTIPGSIAKLPHSANMLTGKVWSVHSQVVDWVDTSEELAEMSGNVEILCSLNILT